MANRIKGLTIEIGGDTTKLDKALKGVNSTIKTTQTSLKDVNKLLKLDPKNTELLTQKQKLLTDGIQATGDKLKTLKEAAAQAKVQLEQGALTQSQYDALQREILDTESELKKLQTEAKNFGSVGAQQVAAVGGQMQELGGKIEDVGKKMSVVSAAVVALGKVSVDAFNEVDDGMDTIIKKTGASGEALEGMEEIFEHIAASVPADFNQIGSAIGEVNTRFGLTGTELEDLSTKFIKFAQLNDEDVSSSIDSVQKAMAAFGVQTEDAGAFLDTLNKVGQNTGISMGALASSLVTNGAYMKEMGFDAATSATFLGQLEKSGIDTSAVMTGLRQAIKNASAEGKPLNQALIELEEGMKNAGSASEATQQAIELFGSRAGVQLAVALRDGTVSLAELANTSATLDDALGNVDDTFEETLDGVDAFKTSSNQLKLTLGELGGTIGETLAPMLEKVTEVLKKLQDGWNKLSPEAQNTIVKIGMIVAAIGPALLIIGKVISTIGTLMTYAPVIIGFLTGPVAPIVALVAAIGLLVGVIVKNWENIKSIISNLKGIFTDMTVVVNGKINELKNNITEKFQSIVNAAKNWGRDMIQNIINGITNMIGKLKSKVKSVADTIASFLHFSVPDEGPLKDFDKSMPDMIDLMVKGIDQNQYKLEDAVNGLAENIASPVGGYNGILGQILAGINNGSQIVLDSGELVGATAGKYNMAFGAMAQKEAVR